MKPPRLFQVRLWYVADHDHVGSSMGSLLSLANAEKNGVIRPIDMNVRELDIRTAQKMTSALTEKADASDS